MNRRHRLRGRRCFADVRVKGVEARSGPIRVRAAGNGLGFSRAGFAIVAAPHAVARNRMRRRLRAIVAPILEQTAGIDVVVTAPGGANRVPVKELRDTVGALVTGAMAEAGRR